MKIPQLVLSLFNPIWNKENRKKILNSFKVKCNYKKTNYSDLYVETRLYSKKIQVYDVTNPLFQEFNNIPLEKQNWYFSLSYQAKTYIKELCDRIKKEEAARPPLNLTPRQLAFMDNRLFELTELFRNDEDYHCFLRKDMTLRNSAIKYFVYERRPLYKPLILLKRVKIYAIEEKKPWFNSRGNLIPRIIKGFLSGEMKIPLSKKEKMKRSIEYTYSTFKALAYSNAEEFKNFVTLTFADPMEKEKHLKLNERSFKKYNEYDLKFTYVQEPKDYELCIKKLNSFLTRLRRKIEELNIVFKYLGVPEYQKNGDIHYHFLFSEVPQNFLYEVPSWLDFDYSKESRRYDKGLKLWVYGKSTVEEIFSKERVSTYLAKYLLKSLREIESTAFEERLNKRRFYYSRNLKKPEIKYELYNDDHVIKEDSYVSLIERTNNNFYNPSQTVLYQVKKISNEEIQENAESFFEEDWL